MPSRTQLTLLLAVIAVFALSSLPQVAAFGAGNIPSFAYLEGKVRDCICAFADTAC
jgi:Heterokaryon incompatibility protein Het-C